MKKTPDGEVVLPPRKIDQDKGRYGDPLPGDTATGATISPPTDDRPPGGITPTLPPPTGGPGPAPHVTPAPGTVADGHVSYVNYQHTALTPARTDAGAMHERGRAAINAHLDGSPMQGGSHHGSAPAGTPMPSVDLGAIADAIHNGIDQAGHAGEAPGFGTGLGVRATGGLGGRRVTS